MKGSVFFDKDRGRWAVSWYWQGSPRVIRRYKGEFMYHEKIAQKCLAMIQGRFEQYQQGLCEFRIEEFTGKGWTDVKDFFTEWMDNEIRPNCKPWTVYGYESYWRNWLEPFFTQYPVMLHEIQLDTLNKLKNSITLTGKGTYNVMNCLRSMMDYAHRCRRIPSIPPFPKRSKYDLKEPDFKWLSENDQMAVIQDIPMEEQPVILFLKYHYRRPSEACALKWKDWDEVNQAFTIRRTFSKGELVESTKTTAVHYIPCDPDFLPIMKSLERDSLEDFVFQNPRATNAGRHYTVRALENLWKAACKKHDLDISLYQGTKHSSCTQFINDREGTDSELQMLTDSCQAG